jgi:hypothetical protein
MASERRSTCRTWITAEHMLFAGSGVIITALFPSPEAIAAAGGMIIMVGWLRLLTVAGRPSPRLTWPLFLVFAIGLVSGVRALGLVGLAALTALAVHEVDRSREAYFEGRP